ncbi:MAG: SGNH/GDSL hydrolase family protein [Lachnospiraceae bacterium]|nr:SGNH/GDSL hydrolase family protein [Lachnospiraceae bacterium]
MNEQENMEITAEKNSEKKDWKKYIFNSHVLFLLIAVAVILFIIFYVKGWGVKIDENYINQHGVYSEGRDCYDNLQPLLDETGELLANHSPHTILFFGNGAFAEDRNSENNVVNMIAKRTGSTVYNCSVEGSYLAARTSSLKYTLSGLDVYNFYWLSIFLTWDEDLDYFDWLREQPGATILPETDYIERTLSTIDMNTVDTIAIMYDASDYLASSPFFNPENSTDVMSFYGNLAAGLDVLQAKYPHVRIIVLSPTYAFAEDENGNYVSSDLKEYNEKMGREALSTYMLKEGEAAGERGITFIDNLYGTFDEDEAPEYLKDNVHLNQKGRELLVQRFIGALTMYDEN